MLKKFLLAAVVFIVNCQDPGSAPSEPECSPADLMSQHDLTQAPAKCAAAKGLSGDVLLCVDFDKVAGLDAPELKGWDFNVLSACSGWEISSGALQIKSYQMLKTDCAFLIKNINLADFSVQKFQEFTLSVKYNIEINRLKQQMAKIYMGSNNEERIMWQKAFVQPEQTLSIKMAKLNIPNGGNNSYQPMFYLYNPGSSESPGFAGWQIKSIAILGISSE